jgi:DNA repair protein RadD
MILMKILRDYQQRIVDDILKELKSSSDPILIDASVGSGKSLILASVLLVMERAGYDALCLTFNSTLIQQNAEAYKLQGGNCGLYVASLNTKETKYLVTFASPNSICQDIKRKKDVSTKKFRIIIIDECHNINFRDSSSMYMRIINHYSMLAQQEQYNFRIIGLSGTCYRNKAESIIGSNMMFKSKLCSISTSWLISKGYLTNPIFGLTNADSIDFSECKVDSFGKFKNKDIEAALSKNERLTGEIMRELVSVVENGRTGAFVFASTKKHCYECARSLPDGQWAVVTGDTPHHERTKILQDARDGIIKYLINVNVLTVGIDITSFDISAFLRPTESLVLYTQAIGRVLRLHHGKESALILDWAGNLQRHGDIDDPIINEALRPKNKDDPDYCIPCFTCNSLNTIHSRRCVGNLPDNTRCTYYFQFKECASCSTKNDITARQCRSCQVELIDPNAKLKRKKPDKHTLNVIQANYWVSVSSGSFPTVNVQYKCGYTDAYENFSLRSELGKKIFKHSFIKMHCLNPGHWYPYMHNVNLMKKMLQHPTLKTPYQLIVYKDDFNKWKISKKIFN